MTKVAIVGAGFMGGMHAQVYHILPEAKLTAIIDIDQDRADKLARKFEAKSYSSLKEALKKEDIDAVDICLPTFLHPQYVIEAVRAEKNVFCEKPIALTLEAADRMIEEVEKKGVKFMVGHVLRFWPEYVKIKEIQESGKLGKLIWVTCTRLSPTPTWAWQGWLTDVKRSGGALVDLHIHDIDFLLYLLGRPSSVYCQSAGKSSSYNHVFTTLSFPEGEIGFAEGGWDMPAEFPFTMSCSCLFEKGALEFNNRYEKTLILYSEGKEPEYPPVETQAEFKADVEGNIAELGGYFSEIKYFIDCLEKNRNPEIAGAKIAREALEVVLLAKKSLETHNVVEV